MNKFEVGEIALYDGTGGTPIQETFPGFFAAHHGQECTIISPLLFNEEHGFSYHEVAFADGWEAEINVVRLRKRPDDQPFTRWFNETILTDCAPSLEESMKTAQKNLASYTQEGSCGL